MSITYTCPHCGAREILEHKLVGRFSRCPQCGQIYPVSAQADVAEAHDPPVVEPAKKKSTTAKSRWRRPVAAGVLLGSCLLFGVLGGILGHGSGERNGPPKPEEQITLTKFDRINLGMTYKEVVAVMGLDGEKFSSRRYRWAFTETYRWNSPWGPSIQVVFEQGRVIEKMHVGLD
jgi:hypothetical protein